MIFNAKSCKFFQQILFNAYHRVTIAQFLALCRFAFLLDLITAVKLLFRNTDFYVTLLNF